MEVLRILEPLALALVNNDGYRDFGTCPSPPKPGPGLSLGGLGFGHGFGIGHGKPESSQRGDGEGGTATGTGTRMEQIFKRFEEIKARRGIQHTNSESSRVGGGELVEGSGSSDEDEDMD